MQNILHSSYYSKTMQYYFLVENNLSNDKICISLCLIAGSILFLQLWINVCNNFGYGKVY